MEIDFVITWVDMNDSKWQRDFVKYSNKTENEKNSVSVARFRDYGLLKFWFRGVEKFTPWVRKIHFITCGQKPEWVDENHPKINLVDHKNFIPEQFLPTYNSVVIERYLHKIPDLAEHFVYFNDDFYIINHLDKMKQMAFMFSESLKNNNSFDYVGEMMGEYWDLKKKLSPKVTNNKINEIYNIALLNGATGGKIIGSGGGGFLLMYCEKKYQSNLQKKLRKLPLVNFRFVNHGSKAIFKS